MRGAGGGSSPLLRESGCASDGDCGSAGTFCIRGASDDGCGAADSRGGPWSLKDVISLLSQKQTFRDSEMTPASKYSPPPASVIVTPPVTVVWPLITVVVQPMTVVGPPDPSV